MAVHSLTYMFLSSSTMVGMVLFLYFSVRAPSGCSFLVWWSARGIVSGRKCRYSDVVVVPGQMTGVSVGGAD